jgi:hypothetical protein
MQDKGYHFGDKIALPSDVTGNAESISISFGDKESNTLTIDLKFFTLGENDVTFNIKMKDGKVVNQDATINVFASKPEQFIFMSRLLNIRMIRKILYRDFS